MHVVNHRPSVENSETYRDVMLKSPHPFIQVVESTAVRVLALEPY